jgi:hypothetical protein
VAASSPTPPAPSSWISPSSDGSAPPPEDGAFLLGALAAAGGLLALEGGGAAGHAGLVLGVDGLRARREAGDRKAGAAEAGDHAERQHQRDEDRRGPSCLTGLHEVAAHARGGIGVESGPFGLEARGKPLGIMVHVRVYARPVGIPYMRRTCA